MLAPPVTVIKEKKGFIQIESNKEGQENKFVSARYHTQGVAI
jgi:hypothetical protein